MRILLLFTLFIFSAHAHLSAQYSKGSWRVNTSSGLNGGYFLADHLLLGAGLIDEAGAPLNPLTDAPVAIWLRQYFSLSSDQRAPYFVEGYLGHSLVTGVFEARAALGKEYPLAQGLLLQGSLSAGRTFGRTTSQTTLGLQLGTSMSFGGQGGLPNTGNYRWQPGDKLFGGALGTLAYTFDRNWLSGFADISFGKILLPNLLVEARANLNSLALPANSDYELRNVNAEFTLQTRYLLRNGKRLQFWGGLALQHTASRGVFRRDNIERSFDGNRTSGIASAGLLYFLTDNIFLDTGLGHRRALGKAAGDHDLTGNLGLKFRLGH